MLRRTAVPALSLALSTAVTGCGGADEQPTSTPSTSASTATASPTGSSTATPTPTRTAEPRPEPTAEPTARPSPEPTTGLAHNGGREYGSCRPEPGEVLLQYPFRAVTATRIEDIGVYPGSVPVKGAWVTPTGGGVPDLVSAVSWPEGFDSKAKATYRWADRKEAVEEVLPKGRYHLFVLADLTPGTTIDGLDIAWVATEGDETGALRLDHKVTVGKCG